MCDIMVVWGCFHFHVRVLSASLFTVTSVGTDDQNRDRRRHSTELMIGFLFVRSLHHCSDFEGIPI